MTRHARNCTAGAVYTYNEKKRDAAEGGYGTNAKRIGKDSVKSFDCCSLTLQPCRYPVVSPDGILYDKEAILKYIISKKNEYSRKLKEYERAMKAKREQNLEKAAASNDNFASTSKLSSLIVAKNEGSISNMSKEHAKKLPSFWLPSECPNAGLATVTKPDSTIHCPVSGKPLKLKTLIDVKFTQLSEADNERTIIGKEVRYICPITRDILSNAVPCAVLRPTGDVVTMECVEQVIRKDMIHPLTNQKLKEKDIIPLQRGGTGYAITNNQLAVKEQRPMLQV